MSDLLSVIDRLPERAEIHSRCGNNTPEGMGWIHFAHMVLRTRDQCDALMAVLSALKPLLREMP